MGGGLAAITSLTQSTYPVSFLPSISLLPPYALLFFLKASTLECCINLILPELHQIIHTHPLTVTTIL